MIAINFKYSPDEVKELTYTEYNDFIKEIGIMYAFESYKGIVGNSYATDAGKVLNEINPMNYKEVDSNGKTKSNLPRVTKEMVMALVDKEPKK